MTDLTPARLSELLEALKDLPDGKAEMLSQLDDRYPSLDHVWEGQAADLRALAARVVELEAQNARLTGALQAVAGPHGYDPPARQDLQAVARAALEPCHD